MITAGWNVVQVGILLAEICDTAVFRVRARSKPGFCILLFKSLFFLVMSCQHQLPAALALSPLFIKKASIMAFSPSSPRKPAS